MFNVRVTDDHFNIGITHHPRGSIIPVVGPVKDYMVKAGTGEVVDDDDDADVVEDTGMYQRRDMQSEPVAQQAAPKPKRKRRTKAEMEAARKAAENDGES